MADNRKTGYKLHLQRLIFSGGEATRSIKYPLHPVSDAAKPIKNTFTDNIIADDLKIRGAVNLPDYVRTPNTYTLADFWVDSLRAGVIWQPTGPKLDDFVRKFYGELSPGELLFEKAAKKNEDLRFFDKEVFNANFISAAPKRVTGSPQGFRNSLSKSLISEYKEDPRALELIDEVVEGFYDAQGKLKLHGKQAQDEFWLRKFGIDKSQLKKKKSVGTNGDLKKLTFFIIPELSNLDSELSPADVKYPFFPTIVCDILAQI